MFDGIYSRVISIQGNTSSLIDLMWVRISNYKELKPENIMRLYLENSNISIILYRVLVFICHC